MAPRPESIQTVFKLIDAMLQIVDRGLLYELNFHVSCEEMRELKRQQEEKLKDSQSAVTTSEVQSVMSSVKASYEATMRALQFFRNYLEAPNEETSEELKQLCDREKRDGNELLSINKINETFHLLRSCLIDETKNSQDSKFQENLMHSTHKQIQVKQDLRNKNKSVNFDNHQERLMKGSEEDEIRMLRAENNELLAELGQITVEKTARENEQKKLENFKLIYGSPSPKAKQSAVTDNTLRENHENTPTSIGRGNGFPKPKARNADPASLVSEDASSGQAVQGAESLVKKNVHQQGKEGMVKNDKDERNLHDGDENRAGMLTESRAGMPVIASKKISGGEGIDQSGSVSVTSNAASTPRERNIDQTSTEQSCESLSFSVQQEYSNEKEKISLRNVPPTSVAATMYNNYKLLLLSLGQMLLSSDVAKLMSWATQNFPIANLQNATHVLFQLDENGVINATDLNQLRHFFESIVRFDLVYIIDAFLLGDYAIFRQIQASKKRDAGTTQNPQHGKTTRYSNFFNAASTSQSFSEGSLSASNTQMHDNPTDKENSSAAGASQSSATSARAENCNEPQSSALPQEQEPCLSYSSRDATTNNRASATRSLNENQSTAYGATGFTESRQVNYDPLTNERRTTTGNSSMNVARNTQTTGSNGSRLSKQRNQCYYCEQCKHLTDDHPCHCEEGGISRDGTHRSEEINNRCSTPPYDYALNEEGDSRERQAASGNPDVNSPTQETSRNQHSLGLELLTEGIPEALDGYDNHYLWLNLPHSLPSL